jgi:hypothetical protein
MTNIRQVLPFLILWIILWVSNGITQPFDFSNQSNQVNQNQLVSNEDTLKTSMKSPTGAMLRSMIVPGWGQLYNRKYLKAILVFGVETGILINSIYLNQKYQSSHTDWDREYYINNRNLSNWWLVGVILFSMADAFVDAHLKDFDESPDLSYLKIEPIVYGDIGVQLSIGFSFSFK